MNAAPSNLLARSNRRNMDTDASMCLSLDSCQPKLTELSAAERIRMKQERSPSSSYKLKATGPTKKAR
jgi:hypothetical protein